MYTGQIKRLASQVEKKYIAVRRHLHQYPEAAFKEEKTSAFIKQHLMDLGLEVRTGVAVTGVIGLLKGVRPGKTFALRSDMDALFLNEENNFDYISKNKGYMHACGHDIHMSAVLGAAEILSCMKDNFDGNIVFIFQPAEEGMGGGRLIVEEGIIREYGVETIIAGHVSPSLPTGSISLRKGPAMASQSEFSIEITGKGGHAAMPHTTSDPIVAGVNMINMLQTLITREKNPVESAVLSVTCFNAGSAFNIIPDRAELKGTVRSFSDDVSAAIDRRMHEMCNSICKALGVECKITYNSNYPAVVNNAETVELITNSAKKIIGDQNVITDIEPVMLSEDFSYYTRVIPGALYNLGCRNPEEASANNLHNPGFNPDESCIKTGMEIMSQCAVDFLK